MDLVSHLRKSLWIPELEHSLERFSNRTYLDWFDQHFDEEEMMDVEFPERFLNYLKGKVSNPYCLTKYPLEQLSFSFRENLAFITTIACVTWNMLCLPSTVPPLERKSAS